jgi:AcrR family transcriptional regulator
VGVSPPSIYLHFADKDALLFAVCMDTFDALDEFIEKAAAGVEDLAEELQARGKAYVRFGLGNPEQYRILFMTRPVGLAPGEEIPAPAAFDHHVQAVQRASEAGLLVEGMDTETAAITLWAGVHGITSLLIAKPTFPWSDIDGLIDSVVATVFRGLSR